jgi:hypothetical protein
MTDDPNEAYEVVPHEPGAHGPPEGSRHSKIAHFPRTMDQRPYFSELLIDVNLAFILASIPATATKRPSAMPEAIRQYSMAVAAVSSARNLRTDFISLLCV